MLGVGASRPRPLPGAFIVTGNYPGHPSRIAIDSGMHGTTYVRPSALRSDPCDRPTRGNYRSPPGIRDKIGHLNQVGLVRRSWHGVIDEMPGVDTDGPVSEHASCGQKSSRLSYDTSDGVVFPVVVEDHHPLPLVVGRALESLKQSRPRELEAVRATQPIAFLVDHDCERSRSDPAHDVEVSPVDEIALGRSEPECSERPAGADQVVCLHLRCNWKFEAVTQASPEFHELIETRGPRIRVDEYAPQDVMRGRPAQ